MKEIEKIVVANGNPAKIERYGRLLSEYIKEVVGLKDVGVTEKPEEHGETAEENAEIKARFYTSKTGLLVFSEDEALYVDFLSENEQPGVRVRRVNGSDEVDDEKLLSHWEGIVAQVPENKRTGRWHIAYCVATPDGNVKTVAVDHPIIFFSPSSQVKLLGWPMSSLEGPVAFNKPHSELTPEERKINDEKADKAIKERLDELLTAK